jgi:predicted transcriptional regulator
MSGQMGTNLQFKEIKSREETGLRKDLEVIERILSKPWKMKILHEVYKTWTEDPKKGLSGYKLARLTKKQISTVYEFLHEMVGHGVFEFLDDVNRVRKVRITQYGIEIYTKIESTINLIVHLITIS